MYVIEDRGHATPCWVWQWGKTSKGYGAARHRSRRQQSAHRWMYERYKGPIPQGLDLDHLCRVKACVNPDHLEPVLNAENVRRGQRAKLTWPDVDAIRASELSHAELARRYRVSAAQVQKIRSNERWNREKQWIRPSQT